MMTEKQQQWANYVHDLTTERIEKYNKNPNLCKQCGVSLPYDGRKNFVPIDVLHYLTIPEGIR